MKLNEKIYQCRKSRGLSQEELAQRIGVTRQAVSKWEVGTSVPELQAVVKLAREFGVTTDYLLTKEEEEQEPSHTAAPKGPERSQPDWTEKLPRFLKRFVMRHGWIGGLYICLQAIPFILGAIWVQFWFSGIGDTMALFPNAVNPFAIIRNLFIAIATLLILTGIVLAILLRRWGRKSDQ